MKSLLDILQSRSEIEREDYLKVLRSISKIHLKKGDTLQHKGDLYLKAYYVKSGLLRSYSLDSKGKEHIFMFAPAGWVIGDTDSQVREEPAELFIDCLEDAEVEVMDPKLLEEAGLDGLKLGGQERLLRRVGVLQKRVIMLMSASAMERYQDFLETYPSIVERVPQRMIASYLGITPEALSKIKSEWLRGNS